MKKEKALIASVTIDLNLSGSCVLWVVEYFSGRTRYYFQDKDIIPERIKAFYHSAMLTHRQGTMSVYRYGNQG